LQPGIGIALKIPEMLVGVHDRQVVHAGHASRDRS
jgi:hypothetical protein